MQPPHLVFKGAYEGIARELISHAWLINPLDGQRIDIARAVWDTGATNSVINHDFVNKLGLAPSGYTHVHTANGSTSGNTYAISLVLPPGTVTIEGLSVTEADLGHDDMLIGMDVIATGDFTVQNYDGRTHYSFCVPPFANKYDMIEKAETINRKFAKRFR